MQHFVKIRTKSNLSYQIPNVRDKSINHWTVFHNFFFGGLKKNIIIRRITQRLQLGKKMCRLNIKPAS